MARINTNPTALLAVADLHRNNRDMQLSIERLSSGLRIRNAGDDPGGLMISEQLKNEYEGLNKAIQNTEEAINFLGTTEAALDEVHSLLNVIQSNVVNLSNRGALTADEIQAAQLQIDSAISSINRIANATEFAGVNLLNGNMAITAKNLGADINGVQAYRSEFPNGEFTEVRYNITQPAQSARVTSKIQNPAQGATVRLLGPEGSFTISVAPQATPEALAQAIAGAVNGSTDSTGITAQWNDANLASDGVTVLNTDPTLVNFVSEGKGSDYFVDVNFMTDSVIQTGVYDFTAGSNMARDTGEDIGGTLNGNPFVGSGNHGLLSSSEFDLDIAFADGVAAGASGQFQLYPTGAVVQIGNRISTSQTLFLGIPSVDASSLGVMEVGGSMVNLQELSTGGGYSAENSDGRVAAEVIEQALLEVALIRGRLGALQANTMESNLESLQVARENVAKSGSAIRDADFAEETANLTRAEILVNAGISVLSTANSIPRSVLQLLMQ